MDHKPPRATGVRIIVLTLFLISMPLTLLNSDGPGMFADSDGWQGYDILLQWPLWIVMLGAWFLIPSAIANAYVLCGMWLRVPMWAHAVAWSICLLALVSVLAGLPAYPAFTLLALAWILSGVGPWLDWRKGVNSPAPTPDAQPGSN